MPTTGLDGHPATAAEMYAVMVRWYNSQLEGPLVWDISDAGMISWEEVYRGYPEGSD